MSLILPIRLTLYVITLLIYVPYFIFSIRRRYYARFPIVFFAFAGMFTYNAIGSIYVYIPNLQGGPFGRDYFSYKFALMLVLQALAFYAATLPFTLSNTDERRIQRTDSSATRFMFVVLAAGICAIVLLYWRNVGVPPGILIITGGLSTQEIIKYRIAGTFGLSDYYIYNVGFMTLPVIMAGLACTAYLRFRRKIYILVIAACAIVSTFPGGKGNISRIGILLLIIGLLYKHYYWRGRLGKAGLAAAVIIACMGAVVLSMFHIYYGDSLTSLDIVNAVCYKLFGSVPETIGGLIDYSGEYGFLHGQTLTDLHGLLKHETFDINSALHVYMYGPGGMTAIPAVTEGYVNFGWFGFLAFSGVTYSLVVALDRLFHWMPLTDLTFSLLAMCCLVATELSQLSLWATFVSLTLMVVIGVLVGLDRFGIWILRWSSSGAEWRVRETRP